MAANLIKKCARFYFGSWYMPLCGLVAAIVFGGTANILMWRFLGPAPLILGVICFTSLIFLLFILAAVIYQFVKRMWIKGAFNLFVLLAICFLGSLPFYMMGKSHDDFGKDIVVPEGMDIETPLQENVSAGPAALDAEGNELLDSFKKVSDVKKDFTELYFYGGYLEKFSGEERKILLRHLSTSCKWFLSRERGRLYAYRRFVVNGLWRNSLNGYYSSFDFPGSSLSDSKRFQVRVAICPDGTIFDKPWRNKVTILEAADTFGKLLVVEDRQFNQGKESYLIVKGKLAGLEIFEQSPYFERVFTPLVLEKLAREFKAVLDSGAARLKGFDASLMPQESIKEGGPEIHLSGQGGIYFVRAYINPGEQGYAYLKVFEATKNTPLSVYRVKQESQECVGWSLERAEQFLYNTQITVYEGDWGVYYPARFELWFAPSGGGSERKLIEKIFKIEGWQS